MPAAIYEFPLNEKVRTYLRLEQLFAQLDGAGDFQQDWQFIGFFESFFTLYDLLERIEIRTDIIKDIDLQERNLVHWSQHPQIDNDALQGTLRRIIKLRDNLKVAGKLGASLKDDRFLMSIRQRFSIPGATCSFDLPNLHYWVNQPTALIQQDIKRWLNEFELVHQAIGITLKFLRERGRMQHAKAENGFFQGVADSHNELIRIESDTDGGYYPILSGNKHRYAIRFMCFDTSQSGQLSVERDIAFNIARC